MQVMWKYCVWFQPIHSKLQLDVWVELEMRCLDSAHDLTAYKMLGKALKNGNILGFGCTCYYAFFNAFIVSTVNLCLFKLEQQVSELVKPVSLLVLTVARCQVCCVLYRRCIFRWQDPHTKRAPSKSLIQVFLKSSSSFQWRAALKVWNTEVVFLKRWAVEALASFHWP